MRTLITLAAGQGTRLLPLTEDRPKCMVPLLGRPLVEWHLAAARQAGVARIVLVAGYKRETIQLDGVEIVVNEQYATTNMVESLWCARPYFEDSVTVAYGDIVYEPEVLQALWQCPHPSAVVVDRAWLSYWCQRFKDPLADAESLRMDARGGIESIGQKERSLEAIQAQYIGLFRLGREAILAAEKIRREQDTRRWFMTDLLHRLIPTGLYAVPIHGQWLEIDSPKDLEIAEHVSWPQKDILRIRR